MVAALARPVMSGRGPRRWGAPSCSSAPCDRPGPEQPAASGSRPNRGTGAPSVGAAAERLRPRWRSVRITVTARNSDAQRGPAPP